MKDMFLRNAGKPPGDMGEYEFLLRGVSAVYDLQSDRTAWDFIEGRTLVQMRGLIMAIPHVQNLPYIRHNRLGRDIADILDGVRIAYAVARQMHKDEDEFLKVKTNEDELTKMIVAMARADAPLVCSWIAQKIIYADDRIMRPGDLRPSI